jgi:threonine aldolase
MSANLKLTCEKFVPGHPPQKAGEEFALIADWCRKNDFAQDYYGKGNLINSFEKKVARLLGFEAACFMPSGTMAQQVALKSYAAKSKNMSFAIHPTSHLELHEQHAYAHLSNLNSIFIGDRSRQLNAQDIVLHMDGARLWETKAFYQKSYREICRGFDSVYVSFYKGIGALTGAMLLGETEFIEESRVWLRRFGGNLYQLHPFVASAAMRFDFALRQMKKYFTRTKAVHKILKNTPQISFCPNPPQVNMFHLYFNTSAEKLTKARDKIAKEDKIWAANNFQKAVLENLSYTEIYVGEGLLQISDEELEQTFSKLIDFAK